MPHIDLRLIQRFRGWEDTCQTDHVSNPHTTTTSRCPHTAHSWQLAGQAWLAVWRPLGAEPEITQGINQSDDNYNLISGVSFRIHETCRHRTLHLLERPQIAIPHCPSLAWIWRKVSGPYVQGTTGILVAQSDSLSTVMPFLSRLFSVAHRNTGSGPQNMNQTPPSL